MTRPKDSETLTRPLPCPRCRRFMGADGCSWCNSNHDTHCARGHLRTPETRYTDRNGTLRCRLCTSEYSREWRARNAEQVAAYRKNYHERNQRTVMFFDPTPLAVKRRAWEGYARGVAAGNLTPEPCLFGCGGTPVEAHHHDYSKPLDVTWLCVRHHRLAHKVPKEIAS